VLAELVAGRAPLEATRPLLDAFLVAVSSEEVPVVLGLAHGLRDRGVRVEFALKAQGLGKQLKLAVARGAPRAVIVGPDERRLGVATVRDLARGTEDRVPLQDLHDALVRN
jgi:histidyl-tRNA synthetase